MKNPNEKRKIEFSKNIKKQHFKLASIFEVLL